MQLQTTGKILHVGPNSNVLRQGENNADAPVITLPASYNGLDLAGLTFVIYADSEVGTRASQTLQKQISGTTIELTWQITSDFTSIPGKLDIILKGYNTENQVVIKWIGDYPIKVTADEGELSAENPPPEYTQALNEMYEILEQTQAIAQYPPLIGENDNWMLYDANAQGYIDSQKPSRGDTGPQGNPGPQGKPGEAATISNVTASVDDTSGDPEVVVTMGGTAQERSFAFAFSGLKGENGKTPVKGVDYWTSEDQQSIVDQVLQDLPNGDEVEY